MICLFGCSDTSLNELKEKAYSGINKDTKILLSNQNFKDFILNNDYYQLSEGNGFYGEDINEEEKHIMNKAQNSVISALGKNSSDGISFYKMKDNFEAIKLYEILKKGFRTNETYSDSNLNKSLNIESDSNISTYYIVRYKNTCIFFSGNKKQVYSNLNVI